ncbi:hypothetical protein IGI37_001255 [Enterococcus sp. AZ194]|uniref:adenylyl-sulfate kinase n=1 Tax=Enterococcus sp. AZ194 TaxID=2774629 RepID=UPI003F1FCEEC
MKTKVIVISGVTAGGKTTLVKELVKRTPDCASLYFDKYDIDAQPGAPELDQILIDANQMINQFNIQPLLDDLLKLINRVPIIYIDFPFGYQHKKLVPYIDQVIYMKTPLDIVFVRMILRDFENQSKEAILSWCETYLTFARSIFSAHETIVSSDVDLIIDGEWPLSEKMVEIQNFFVEKAIDGLD